MQPQGTRRRLTALVAAASLSASAASHYAVLIAGSNGYGNYRHQSDVCHASNIMQKNGILPENIITMIYDDIANDPANPFQGQVFNKPADGLGVDVYAGCNPTYKGNDVNAVNFLAVLTGNKSAATGPVLTSTADDEVFVYFADHGASGLVAMPTGPYLYANDLLTALSYMHTARMYRKLTFYMEACESGSMFQDILPPNISVYATTAANAFESSWGTYCPPEDSVNGTELGTCLGDLYSVNWMENVEAQNKTSGGHINETLYQQYAAVANATNLSHVMAWGDMSFQNWTIDTFEGNGQPPSPNPLPALLARRNLRSVSGGSAPASGPVVVGRASEVVGEKKLRGRPARNAKAASNDEAPANNGRGGHRTLRGANLDEESNRNSGEEGDIVNTLPIPVDITFGRWDARYATLLSLSVRLGRMNDTHPLLSRTRIEYRQEIDVKQRYDAAFGLIAGKAFQARDADEVLDKYAPLHGSWGATEWGCYKTTNSMLAHTCGRVSDYALRYLRMIALMCEAMPAERVQQLVTEACDASY